MVQKNFLSFLFLHIMYTLIVYVLKAESIFIQLSFSAHCVMDLFYYFHIIIHTKLLFVMGEEVKVLKSMSHNSWAEIANSSIEGLDEFTLCFRFYQEYFKIPGYDNSLESSFYLNIFQIQMK